MSNKTDKLNVFLANLAVLNIKVHNLHWNVVGLQFPLIHKMTEKIYKMLQCQFDTVAEVMKMQNKMPAASMAEYLDKTTIDELEARDYHGYEVLEELSADCDILIASAKEVRDEADKAAKMCIRDRDFPGVFACVFSLFLLNTGSFFRLRNAV